MSDLLKRMAAAADKLGIPGEKDKRITEWDGEYVEDHLAYVYFKSQFNEQVKAILDEEEIEVDPLDGLYMRTGMPSFYLDGVSEQDMIQYFAEDFEIKAEWIKTFSMEG